MELQSPRNKKQEIRLLKTEKEKFVEELKQQVGFLTWRFKIFMEIFV